MTGEPQLVQACQLAYRMDELRRDGAHKELQGKAIVSTNADLASSNVFTVDASESWSES